MVDAGWEIVCAAPWRCPQGHAVVVGCGQVCAGSGHAAVVGCRQVCAGPWRCLQGHAGVVGCGQVCAGPRDAFRGSWVQDGVCRDWEVHAGAVEYAGVRYPFTFSGALCPLLRLYLCSASSLLL